MRCFVLLMVLIGDAKSPVYLQRDLMTKISPLVPAECAGKAMVTFNGGQPSSCVAESPRQVMEAPCYGAQSGTKPN